MFSHRGYRVRFYCNQLDPPETWPSSVGRGLELVQFQVGGVAREAAVPWTSGLERGLCYAYGAWEVFDTQRPRPIDLVLGRSFALGSSLFASVSYPAAPVVNLFDYYVHPRSGDLFDEDAPALPLDYHHWRRSANAMDLLDLENGVLPWTPTLWQRDLYPPEYRDDFLVLHDGIDTDRFARPERPRRMLAGRSLPEGTKVVTWIARRAERLRGFDRFVALAHRLIAERSDVVCVAIGGAPVERMLDIPFHSRDYASHVVESNPPTDPSRLWLLGDVPPATVAEVLQSSHLHVVPSRPYPVSRSTIKAMAAGAGDPGLGHAADPGIPGRRRDRPHRSGRRSRRGLGCGEGRFGRPGRSSAHRPSRRRFGPRTLRPRRHAARPGRTSDSGMLMKILFIHQAFPAQFGRLALELTERYGWDCTFLIEDLSSCPTPSREMLEKLTLRKIPIPADDRDDRPTPWPQIHGKFLNLCRSVYDGVAALPDRAFDLVVGHGGRGAPTVFLPDLLDCPIVNYCEYFFSSKRRGDISYRVDLPPAVDVAPFFPRCINAPVLVALQNADAGYSATHWQRSTFPARYQDRIEVHFDGLDTEFYRPRSDVPRSLGGRSIPEGTRLVTFVARGLESMRGFDIFLEVAARIARERSDVLFVITGTDQIYYGWDTLHTGGQPFRDWALARTPIDPSRLIFLGHVPPDRLAEVLALSDLHLYLTVPFVLSWSLLNAMSCARVVLGSDVPPVREVIEPGQNGLVEPLFDVDRLTRTALAVLDDPAEYRPLGDAAEPPLRNITVSTSASPG